MMTRAELSNRVRHLELRARKNVSHLGEGAYRSAFKGQGIEFQEIREYMPGDDIRSIDWNVTARQGRAYVKRFIQERGQTVMLLVDASASTRFGGKSEVISELVATLAWAAVENSDRVGLIIFGGEVELFIAPGTGVNHALRLMREVAELSPRKPGTDLAAALRYLDRLVPRRAFAFLLSDFFAPDASEQLRITARRHNVVALSVNDPREADLPDCGLVEVRDPESGEQLLLDTSDPIVREAFARHAQERDLRLRETLRGAGVDHLNISAGADYFPQLIRFLRNHATSF